MHAPEYRIDDAVFVAHPDYRRGVVLVDAADNGRDGAALVARLREAEAAARERVTGNVAEVPRVAAWREAYRRFGAKPSEHRSAIEALLRRVTKPDALPSINPLVDLGNAMSLAHLLPIGVHPLDGVEGSLALRPAREGDVFAPPDGGPPESPPAGEIVLARGATVLTRRWTWRQAAGTQILPTTTRCFVNVDGLPPATADEVDAAMREVATLVAERVGGRVVRAEVLSAVCPSMSLAFD
ncbi:MAG: phenylalanine--tRNA ligase beta subunit-related protein [Burkholderiales bacterium]|jgi:DNA/RNA-binding domain of Phe-tRNA-synthetase-like protein